MADTWPFTNAFNFEVDCASSGNNTIVSVPAGRKLVVFYLFVQAEADVEVEVRSGATALSAPINFTTATMRERTFSCSGIPVFKTIAAGDDLVFNLSGAVQVNGTGFAMEVQQ